MIVILRNEAEHIRYIKMRLFPNITALFPKLEYTFSSHLFTTQRGVDAFIFRAVWGEYVTEDAFIIKTQMNCSQNLEGNLVFDSGFGTALEKRFLINEDPLWSARLLSMNQDAIIDVHKSFLRAGADVILSNTYQASINGFQKYLKCSFSEAENLIQQGGKLVKRACEEFWENMGKTVEASRMQPLACASMGPYGACLHDRSEYTGSYIEEISQLELKHWHDQRLKILSKENLDLYLFETIPALGEAEAIIQLIKEYPNLKFAVSFSCKDGIRTSHGELLSDAVSLLNRSNQVVAVGVNCTSPLYISSLLRSIKGKTQKKILIKPNIGEVWENNTWINDLPTNTFLSYLPEWIEIGAHWIGGCCRTTPEDITNIRSALYGKKDRNVFVNVLGSDLS